MAIENNITKELTLRNEIRVNDLAVVGQTATVNQVDNKLNLSEWIINVELYEANHAEVCAKKAEFEEFAFAEKNKMATAQQ